MYEEEENDDKFFQDDDLKAKRIQSITNLLKSVSRKNKAKKEAEATPEKEDPEAVPLTLRRQYSETEEGMKIAALREKELAR